MAISFVANFEGQRLNNGVDLSIALSGLAENDIAYVAICNTDDSFPAAGVPTTAGYTQLGTTIDTGSSLLRVYRKTMGSTPDTSVAINCTGDGNGGVAAVVHVLRGVDTTTPEDNTVTQAQGTAAAPNPPAVTTVTANAWVIVASSSQIDDTSVTAPAGYSNKADINRNNVGVDGTVGIASRTIATPATEDPAAWTTWTAANWGSYSIAVRPAGVAAGARSRGFIF